MQVQLFKKVGPYTDKDGKEKQFTNFYLKCGDAFVPIEVCYFPQAKFDNRDPNYNGRKQVLSAFALHLPDKPNASNGSAHTPARPSAPSPDEDVLAPSAPPPDEDVLAPSGDDIPF